MAETVLVTGATGNTGGPLVDLLEHRGANVRVMFRREADAARFRSAAVAIADLDDDGAVSAALEGIDRAYLVTPSSERAEAQQLRFAELAAAAGVRHVVKLSQSAAAEGSPVRFLRYHAVVERRIRELGLGYRSCGPTFSSRDCSRWPERSASREASSRRLERLG